jgi:hypothetical protein
MSDRPDRPKRNRNLRNLLLDIGMFIVFLLAMDPHLTGLAIHEWISLAFGATIIVHLLWHWEWIVGVTRRLFGRMNTRTRLNYILNSLLFIAFTLIIASGLMISEEILPLLGLQLEHSRFWRWLHGTAADASILVIGLHVALHWSWIVNMFKRMLGKRKPITTAPTGQRGEA